MGFIVSTVKWGVKLGVSGGALYVAHHHNLFGSATQAQQGLELLQKNCTEMVPKEVAEKVPDVNLQELKDMIPAVEFNLAAYDARSLWNRGIFATFGALANSPTTLRNYSDEAVKYISEQMK